MQTLLFIIGFVFFIFLISWFINVLIPSFYVNYSKEFIEEKIDDIKKIVFFFSVLVLVYLIFYVNKSKTEKLENNIPYEEVVESDYVQPIDQDVPSVVDKTSTDSEIYNSYGKPDVDPCSISIEFIKQDLTNPSTIDYSIFDCSPEWNGSQFVILRKISAANSFGVEKEYIYKLYLKYLGGHELDMSSWELVSLRSEEYR